jgi:hypothetical protein
MMTDPVSRLREYAGDGTALGDDVAEVLDELDRLREIELGEAHRPPDGDGPAPQVGTRIAVLERELDAALGIICNAHQKRVDDVTNDDGASPGWAEAARRWIDAYPFR